MTKDNNTVFVRDDDQVERNWEEFWKEIVCNPDGSINVEQLKKELSDFSYIMEQIPKVYCHITGDRLSKVFYSAETVITVADDYQEELFQERLKDESTGQDEDDFDSEDYPDHTGDDFDS